jgi:Fe-S cluster assembly protein SufB
MTDQIEVPRSTKQLTEEEAALRHLRTEGSYLEKYGFHFSDENYVFRSRPGLDAEIVAEISHIKGEPAWMTEFRLKAYETFMAKPLPTWGGDLSGIKFDEIYYYVRATDRNTSDWDEVPDDIKETFDRLGIPEAERKFLAGVGSQYESEMVYHRIQEELERQGVIFLSMDDGLRQHPDIVKRYFGSVIPYTDNKFAALNSAVWSGGSFIYVPKGVHIEMPLQAYFRINSESMGQFERTLIIVDEGASVHYVEGCLPAGELVSLGDRWTNVEAIRPGDNVLDSNGVMGRVEKVMTRPFRGNLITIHPLSEANTFQLTPEHPVLVVRRERVRAKRNARKNWLPEVDSAKLIAAEPEFIPAGELQRGDFLVFPICKVVKDDYRYTREVMRLLGYYLAEGSAYIHNTLKVAVVAFSFNMAERESIEEVKALIRSIIGKEAMEITQEERHSTEVRVYSQELFDLCLEACGKLADHKQLSKTVMELPTEKQAALLETYLRGDGSTYQRRNKMVRASTASQALAWQLQELLARQGHYATISIRKGGVDKIGDRTIHRNDQYILYFPPDKQQSEVRRTTDYFLVPIKKIEQIPFEGNVFNFELASDPNAYLVRGFAVHNCTAPVYSRDSLHSAVVEIIVHRGARCRYTTIQNWSNNVYNLVTKRAVAYADATMEWVDANLGSQLTMKYPAVHMMEPGAHGEILSIAFAGHGQHQDAGGKVVHHAPNTTSRIISKSISKDGGRASYRGLLRVDKGATGVRSNVVCDALLLDEASRSDTYPYIEVDEQDVTIGHEASVSKIGEEQLFYLMSRGLNEDQANAMIVNGFIEPLAKELPMEYSIELRKLIEIQLEGTIG